MNNTSALSVEEGNKLIVAFVGAKIKKSADNGRYYVRGSMYPDCLQYRSSWNWIMSVVDKIENLEKPYSVEITKHGCSIRYTHFFDGKEIVGVVYDDLKKIEGVWEACVQFIQWYKQNQQSLKLVCV